MSQQRIFRILLLATLFGVATSYQVCGQYYPNRQEDPMAQVQNILNSYGDPMQQMQGLMNDIDAQQHQLARQLQLSRQKTIKDFRAMTGDYRSPDSVILQRSAQMARRHNPELFRMQERAHQQRMSDIASWGEHTRRMGRIYSEIGDSNLASWRRQQEIIDRGNERFRDNVIWEQSTYTSPSDGQKWKIEWNQPGQFHRSGSDTFFTDQSHNQFRSIGNGLWEELEEEF